MTLIASNPVPDTQDSPKVVPMHDMVGHPDWFVKRLYKALERQAADARFYNDYYVGDPPLPWLAPQAREEFRRILRMARLNVLGLVADATMERANIEGFRFGSDSTADSATWDIWQWNNMDADSNVGFLESLIAKCSYYLVEPNRSDRTKPYMWVEDATQCIVEYAPGSNRRVRHAGLKMWVDDWTAELCTTLFLMVDGQLRVYKYRAENPNSPDPRWLRREVKGEVWGGLGGMDRIPLVEVPNNPRIKTGGRSEFEDLTDSQDRINKTLADRLIDQDYGSFPQKWATAWPEFQEDGVTPVPPIDVGRARMVTTDVEGAKFGQWDASPLDPYLNAIKEDIKSIASRSRTPAQYLLGDMSNVNGETLKASESGHIAKVRQRMRSWGEATEEAIRMVRQLAGLSSANEHRMETVWANPEFRTEGELTDATVKKLQSRIASLRQARVDVGYSETEIQRLEKDDQNEALHPVIQNALREIGTGNGAPNAPRGV